MSESLQGPKWASRNWAADEKGGIHDDATASKLGFRGGTVPGDVHMNAFVPLLLDVFGDAWWQSGHLSLSFKNATVDGEPVVPFAKPLEADAQQTEVWMEREDGLLICTGTAGLGDTDSSELHTRDLRPCDPQELRILRNVSPGMSLGSYSVVCDAERQLELLGAGLIGGAQSQYAEGDEVYACPSTMVQKLWGIPMQGLRPHVGKAVGLFGAIEVAHVRGPMLLNRKYQIDSEVVSVGDSPKTEVLWFDTRGQSDDGQCEVTFRMMLRFMKASSEEYAEAQ